jgi:hypothetical protein
MAVVWRLRRSTRCRKPSLPRVRILCALVTGTIASGAVAVVRPLAMTWDTVSAGVVAPAGPVEKEAPWPRPPCSWPAVGLLELAAWLLGPALAKALEEGAPPSVPGAASMPSGRRVPTVTALGQTGEEESSASSKKAGVSGSWGVEDISENGNNVSSNTT